MKSQQLQCAHTTEHYAFCTNLMASSNLFRRLRQSPPPPPHPSKNLCQSASETGMSALHSASSSGPPSRMRKYSSNKGSEGDRDGPNPYVRSIIPGPHPVPM